VLTPRASFLARLTGSTPWQSELGHERSEQVGFAHNTHELLFGNLAITIAVSLLDHLLNLVVGHVFTKLFGDALEVAERDLACLVVIKQLESLEHLLAGVSLGHLLGHHV